MRKVSLIVALIFVASMSTSCADKIQNAKTVLTFVNLGIQTADSAFQTAAVAKKAECLQKGAEGTPAYVACYKGTADVLAKWAIIKPKLELSAQNSASYIKAAESGKPGDYAAAVKESVCLLTQVAQIIPGDWKKKIQMFLDLAGAYACGATSSTDPARDLQMLRYAHRLMTELLIS